MRKLTGVEQQYWVDSFPYDLRAGLRAGAIAALLVGYLADRLALRYWALHVTLLDPGQHSIAALFLAVLLAIFAFVGTVAAVMVVRLFLRMYRNPL